jgi:DNA-binding GntR family transcriptional regulator
MRLRDQAYHAFIQHLLDQRLRPGQFVTQRELAALTGQPLGAVREMIPRLEADGLLRTLPQRGLQVATLDLAMMRDAFQLRETIECAALVQFVRTAPDSAIAVQQDLLDRVMRAAPTGITPALLADAQAVDWGLHDALVDALGNGLIADIHRVNAVRIRLIMQDRVTLTPDRLPPAMAEHATILAAVARRDPDAALAALRAHLDSARDRALAFNDHTAARTPRALEGVNG